MSENENPWRLPTDPGGSEHHSWIPLESSPDGVVSLDAEGYIVNCNDGVCQLLGFTANDLREQSFSELLTNTTAGQPSWIDRVKRDGRVEEELEIVDHSGQTILVKTRAVALHNADGDVVRVVVYIQDITERKKLDQLRDEFIGAWYPTSYATP